MSKVTLLAFAALLAGLGLSGCGSGGAEPAAGDGGRGVSVSVSGCASGPVPAVLTWDAVTGPVPAAGYRLHYGTAPGTYLQVVDVGNVTTTPVTGLSSGTTYYFAATALDASNNESAFSNEVCKTIS